MAKGVLLALALAASVTADTGPQPSFRSGAVGVRVDALVTDGRKPVAGLSASDFELRDNGVLQSIQLVAADDIPLNIVLALDTSATTGKRHADLMAASAALLDEALGRFEEASRHYESALGLFPDAQSALLAASQLALLQADIPAALAPIERLGARSVEWEADPWRWYDYCTGRDADELLQALWDRLPR